MGVYEKAKEWIKNNTAENDGGIIVTSKQRILYPEVTGYYIPTLVDIGEIELAKSFAKNLCSKQREDGSWYDSYNESPFIFDAGQILKGLMAIRTYMPEVDSNIIKGIDWILSNMNDEGRLVQPSQTTWGNDDTIVNELIHIYAISPILEAATVFNKPEYAQKVNKILDYYIANYRERIVNYTLFSHFYAYVVDGLIDCGRKEIAIEAMKNFEKYRKSGGRVCAYNDVNWVCSTATFQFAIIWYKLGETKKADEAYEYMCSKQNPSGGWYGSYDITKPLKAINKIKRFLGIKVRGYYIYDEEISWAVKYYFDATNYKKGLKDK